jgi:hypothetical protein
MPSIDFDDNELSAVTSAVRKVLNRERYPLSPRLDPLKTALAKLAPGAVRQAPPGAKPLSESSTRNPVGRRARH